MDRKRENMYVSVSNGAAIPELFAFDIDSVSGALTQKGLPLVPAGGRIINLSINHQGTHLALANNVTNQAATVALAADGSLAGEVVQTVPATTGPFPHQAKFDDAGKNLIVPGLALNGGDGTFTVFGFKQGQLTKTQTLTLPPGIGARHVDFGHSGRFVYATIERGNRLYTYRFKDGLLSETPRFDQTTLADPSNNAIARQRAGAIHVHPKKPFLYLSNRQDTLVGVTLPGENNIAVYALDAAERRAPLLQHIDTRGVEARVVHDRSDGPVPDRGQPGPPHREQRRHPPQPGGLPHRRRRPTDLPGQVNVTAGDVFWVGALACAQRLQSLPWLRRSSSASRGAKNSSRARGPIGSPVASFMTSRQSRVAPSDSSRAGNRPRGAARVVAGAHVLLEDLPADVVVQLELDQAWPGRSRSTGRGHR